MKIVKTIIGAAFTLGLAVSVQAAEQPAQPKSNTLNELYQSVKQKQSLSTRENRERERIFQQQRDRQQQLLSQAKAELQQEEQTSEQLKATFEGNEKALAEMEETLRLAKGNLGEMEGVVRQVAGELASDVKASLVSAQYPQRYRTFQALAQGEELPQIPELREFWAAMLFQMIEQGKAVTFEGDIVTVEGEREKRTIDRVGTFNLLANGEYVVFDSESMNIKELTSQPAERFTETISGYQEAQSGVAELAMDFSRGTILEAETRREGWGDRVMNYAGIVGAAIGVVLLVGLLIALERLVTLTIIHGKIKRQAKSSTPGNNALGRIMSVYLANKDDDVENLELKLDEAVLKETPKVERGIGIIKVFAAIAPLLGLLGTVTGMIETFQSITLYGAGDPKTMAGGISSALITTVLGIVAAIPLILLHAVVAAKSKGVIHVLEEQSTGLIAQHVERK